MAENKVIDDKRKKEILDELLNNMNKMDDNDTLNDAEKEDETEALKDSSNNELETDDKIIEDNGTQEDNGELDDNDDEEYVEKRTGGTKIIFGVVLTTVIIAVAIFCALFILRTTKEVLGIGKQKMQVIIEIPTNSGTADIANILLENNVISDTTLFRAFSKIKGSDGTFIAGVHKLNMNMSYADIISELQDEAINEREVADVTFPEGISLYDAAQLLEQKGVCNADDFLQTFNTAKLGFDFEQLAVVDSMKFYKMEGYCFPDTYRFYVDEEPLVVVKKIYKNFDAKVTPDVYGRLKDLDMTLEDMLTLASIVQAEAPDKRNMRLVASVYYNRLNNPTEYPKLQSDPTRDYVNNIIKPNIDVPCQEMYDLYNTYAGTGLPPGPICNPGTDAIDAVLYPVESDYYYFCTDLTTGEFFYAETLEEHEDNLVLANLV